MLSWIWAFEKVQMQFSYVDNGRMISETHSTILFKKVLEALQHYIVL